MDAFEPARSFRRSKAIEVSVSLRDGRSVHEESWYHLRLHEEALLGPKRCALPKNGSQQKIATCKCCFQIIIATFYLQSSFYLIVKETLSVKLRKYFSCLCKHSSQHILFFVSKIQFATLVRDSRLISITRTPGPFTETSIYDSFISA